MEESKGFKGDIGKQKELNRARKKDARTQKEKRAKKVAKLSQNDKHWSGLESRDIRTPDVYFKSKEATQERLESIKGKLDDLMVHLQNLRQKGGTPAQQELVKQELTKAVKKKEKREKHQNSISIVDEISEGNTDEAVDLMKYELDRRIHKRVEPFLKVAGSEIEEQIFGG